MPTPSLLLLHGVGDSGACWGPFVAALRQRDLADLVVRTPDAPAHGGRRAEPGHTIAFADQLAEAVGHAEELAVDAGRQLVVGGHSMGSATALAVAATRPDLVAGLWLEDPPMFTSMSVADGQPAGEPTDLSELRSWFADMQAISLERATAGARAEHPDWNPAEYEPWARAKQSVDLAGFDEPVPWVLAGWAAHARAVTCPVVVAAGEVARGSILSSAAEADLTTLPNWSITRLPAGHDVRRDAPAATTDLLAELIHSVQRSAGRSEPRSVGSSAGSSDGGSVERSVEGSTEGSAGSSAGSSDGGSVERSAESPNEGSVGRSAGT